MNFVAVCGFCILSLFLVEVLKGYRSSLALPVAAVAALTVGLYALATLAPAVELIWESSASTVAYGAVSVMLKSLGIGFFTGIAADLCKEAGESALQRQMEFFGKSLILALSIPLFKELLSSAMEFTSF